MKQKQEYLEFTWILIKDEATGYYSACFAEIPEAIAQGKTQKEAKKNLLQIIPFVLHDRKEDALRLYDKGNTIYKDTSVYIPVPAA